MLTKFISLDVIEKIFVNETAIYIDPSAKMLYITCLINHFKNKKPSIANLNAFRLTFEQAGMPTDNILRELGFKQLVNCGFVLEDDQGYVFNNLWSKYMNLNLLEDHARLRNLHLASFYGEMILSNQQYLDIVAMKNKIKASVVVELFHNFIKEQDSINNTYPSMAECQKHFMNWVRFNKDESKNKVFRSSGTLM